MRKMLFAIVILGASMVTAGAQTSQSSEMSAPQASTRIYGKASGVNKDSFTITTQNGSRILVKISERTEIRQQTQRDLSQLEPRKQEDIKEGETIAASGSLKGNVLEATRIVIQPIGGVIGAIIGPAIHRNAVLGKAATVNRDSMILARLEDGSKVMVKVSERTKIVKHSQGLPGKDEQVKPQEITATDMVVAIGLLKDGVLEAERIFVNPVMGAVPEIRAVDMGKTFIVGRVKGIQGDKLTIERPDAGLQEIRMNESTTFQWLSEDISLLDIRVGDTICGPGELKDNVFMAKQLFLISAESAASQPHGHPK